ncbi:MAG: AlpA family phage regulatory protein [Planctomycetes bacterium]|nr:AlpA family phage regulatory protein [Planctomycetota bacterium]MCD7895350.1 AlpA family phage regulatory protein [Planctomycetaceae bacterium]
MQNNGTAPTLPTEGFVRLPVVLGVLGIGKTSFWRGIHDGRYPHPVKLGPRTSAWRVEDIRAVIAKYKAEAGNEATEGAANGK